MVYQTRSRGSIAVKVEAGKQPQSKKSKLSNEVRVVEPNKPNGKKAKVVQVEESCPANSTQSSLLEGLRRFDRSFPTPFLKDNPRQAELDQLKTLVNSCIASQTNLSLYVSGLPGLGKTFTLNQFLSDMQSEVKVEVSYLNCVSVPASQFLTTLNQSLNIQTKNKDAKGNWAAFQKKVENMKGKRIVVVLDEVDHILAQNERTSLDTIYKLFQLSHKSTSGRGIVLITVANDLNLIQDKLPQLVTEQIVPNTLPFVPYTQTQILNLLESLTSDLFLLNPNTTSKESTLQPLFDSKALDFCSRVVITNFQADLRKAFDLIKLTLQRIQAVTPTPTKPIGLVDINTTLQTINKASTTSVNSLTKLNLTSLVILMVANQLVESQLELTKPKIVDKVVELGTKYSELNQLLNVELDTMFSNLDDQNLLTWQILNIKGKNKLKKEPTGSLHVNKNLLLRTLNENEMLKNLLEK